MKIIKNTQYFAETDEGLKIPLEYKPYDMDSIEYKEIESGHRVVYFMPDEIYSADDLLEDVGKIFTCSRRDGQLKEYESAVKTKYHVMLSVYEHSGRIYSLLGGGQQCPWDTINGGAVWIPSDWQVEELDKKRKSKKATRPLMLEYAKTACEIYTAAHNGDVWGVAIEEFDKDLNQTRMDCCWGIFGYTECKKMVKTAFETGVL